MKGICKLCGRESELQRSHLIPKFVINWLKDTSVTGYLRQAVNINLRQQDGPKEYLFCWDCEQLIGTFESRFAEVIFHPYISGELDDWGSQTGAIKFFDYDKWLLKFVVSLQLRDLLSMKQEVKDDIGSKNMDFLENQVSIFKEFLLGKRNNTGENHSYIIFFQNLMFGNGTLPKGMSKNINLYLLRSIDSTVIVSPTTLGNYSKIGPIAFVTSYFPSELKDMSGLIHQKGRIPVVQYLKNRRINNFIFIDRPNESFQLSQISSKQQEIIEKSFENNKDRTLATMHGKALLSDEIMSHN